MAVIEITKRFVSSKFPDISFEEGVLYDATIPFSEAFESAIVERELPSSKQTTNETIQTVKIEVPKDYFRVFSGRPNYLPIDSSGYVGETAIDTTLKKDKNIKFIALGILLVGAVSYLIMKNKK